MVRNRRVALLAAAVGGATALLAMVVAAGSQATAEETPTLTASASDSTPSPTAAPSPTPSATHSPTPTPGDEGCTPGFWKSHPQAWPPNVATTTPVGSVFAGTGSFSNTTLLQALSLQGGPGIDGATEILLRAAVAAYLNSLTVDYAFSTAQVVALVNAALASGQRETILAAAARLDAANNATCPL